MDFTRLSLNNSVSLDNCSQVDRYEQELKREEFKNKILLNCGLIQEQSDEDKIRQDFKKQILSNLDKKGPTTNKPSSAAKSNDEKIRDDFKNQILSNLSRGTNRHEQFILLQNTIYTKRYIEEKMRCN